VKSLHSPWGALTPHGRYDFVANIFKHTFSFVANFFIKGIKMREKILSTIEKNKMLQSAESVVVGLSGGADSVCLLHFFLENRVFACHVNHNLRGAESDADEKFVRELCATLGVPLKVYQASFEKFSEEAARNARYEFLEKARAEFNADRIAVAHNADDNAETVLMNLCRGAGLAGLGGIPPTNGRIIRPLLETSRAEIEEYLREKKIKYLTDSSNLANDFTRNRVRNIVLPMLEKEINSNVKEIITKNAELIRDDNDFLEKTAAEAFASCAEKNRLNIAKLTALPPAICRRVIRRAIAEACGDLKDITSAHIAAVQKLSRAQTGREIHLPSVIVAREYEHLYFFAPTQSKKFFYELKENSPIFIPEIKKTVSLFLAAPQTHCTKAFSYDKITTPLVLRTRMDGDKITFKDAGGKMFTKKLQDYFTDEKIPRSRRDSVPLLASGYEILWIMDDKNRTNAAYEAGDKNIFICVE
jgi:tRNA(Ile)-lysidine synthase